MLTLQNSFSISNSRNRNWDRVRYRSELRHTVVGNRKRGGFMCFTRFLRWLLRRVTMALPMYFVVSWQLHEEGDARHGEWKFYVGSDEAVGGRFPVVYASSIVRISPSVHSQLCVVVVLLGFSLICVYVLMMTRFIFVLWLWDLGRFMVHGGGGYHILWKRDEQVCGYVIILWRLKDLYGVVFWCMKWWYEKMKWGCCYCYVKEEEKGEGRSGESHKK